MKIPFISNEELIPLKKLFIAIDLGSNSVRAMAAERIDENTLRILGTETSTRFPCVDNGVVVQTSYAGHTIREITQLLCNRISVKDMPYTFVVNGGQSMGVHFISWKRDLLRPTEITTKILDDMERECIEAVEKKNKNASVVALVPAYYELDGKMQEERPQEGQKATILKVFYSMFAGKYELRYKVRDSYDHAFKIIEGSFARPDALLSAFTSDAPTDVLTNGCAVIDFGAQTTTVAIYKENQYLDCKVIPIGGWHITRYIENKYDIDIRYAEKIKTEFGYATPDAVEKELVLTLPTKDNYSTIKVSVSDLAATIKQVVDKQLEEVMKVLRNYDQRIETVLLSGGGSMLKGLAEYLQEHTDLDVQYGNYARLLAPGTPDEYYSPEYASLVGALILGSDYRQLHPNLNLQKDKKSLKERIKEYANNITDNTLNLVTINIDK